MSRHFNELLNAQWKSGKFLCVGLDTDYEKIPETARKSGVRESIVAFNRAIVDATKDIVCAYKPNSAFYEAHGDEGFAALRETIEYALEQAPEAVVILDAKRADIGNTNLGYITSAFDHLRTDAITIQPYAGYTALEPFFSRPDKGVFVWCRSSNDGAGEFQDLSVGDEPLYIHVARNVAGTWNGHGNAGLVVGATYPEDIARVRKAAPELPFLIPGVGTQGGDLEKSVMAAKNASGTGFVLSVSRGVLYASSGEDFAQAARGKAREFDTAIRKVLA
jgi:orotidine-5'-phosphate decarboxylase